MFLLTNPRLLENKYVKSLSNDNNLNVFGDWVSDTKYEMFFKENKINIIDIKKVHFSVKDRAKLDHTYRKYLIRLTKFLNNHHCKNYPLRNWEIIIGPWLRVCLSVIYSKLLILDNIDLSKDYKFITKKFNLSDVVSTDFKEFIEMTYDDDWNTSILSMILKIYGYKIKYIDSDQITKTIKKSKSSNKFLKLFNKLITLKNRKVFITGLGMNRMLQSIATLITLNGINQDMNHNIQVIIDTNFRNKFFQSIKDNDKLNLDQNIFNLILSIIPPIYLEQFALLSDISTKLYPKNALKVITSIDHFNNETFKCWLGIKLNKKTEYLILQHGGTYGVTKYSSHHEFIEDRTASYRLTWGWNDDSKNTIPFLSLKLLTLNLTNQRNSKKIAILCTRLKSYSRHDPWDTPKWNNEYTKSIIAIINGCEPHVSKNLLVRLHPQQEQYGLDLEMLIRNQTEMYNFDNEKNIQYVMKNSQLCICTNNATAFLECLKVNKPSILFLWDYKLSPLSKNSKKDYKRLIDVGIVFIDIDKLINFLNNNFNYIDKWWKSEKVQEAKILFNEKYANTNISYLSKLFTVN